MDSKDIRNLSEAYLEVYQVDEAEKWIQKAIKKPGALSKQLGVPEKENIPAEKLAAAVKKGGKLGKRARLAMTLKGLHREEIDLYDIIFSHLLDEGYANTPEAANVIMANMSEVWRESILEGYLPWDKPRANAPSPRDVSARRQSEQQRRGTPAGAARAQQISNVRTNMRQGINATAARTLTDPKREGTAPLTPRHVRSAMTTGGTAGGKMFAAPAGGPKPSGVPSSRIPTSSQVRSANQAAQSRRGRGGSSSAGGVGSSSGSGATGRFQVGGSRGYGISGIRLAD